MRILIVEDDPALARALRDGFRDQRFEAVTAMTYAEGRERALLGAHDVIVLDIMLPGGSGLDLCREIRERGIETPIIILTARDAVEDRVRGLDAGADDYLAKPFSFRELAARVRALSRRAPAVIADCIDVADLSVNLGTRQVSRAGRDIELTAKEFALLEVFARHAGHVLDRAAITAYVWDENHDPFTNVLEVLVRRLRRKIDDDFEPKLIHTLRGAGIPVRALTVTMQPLTALRLRLTAWYVGTLGLILVLLGIGLFVVVRHQFARQLDVSLQQATLELQRAARIREQESRTTEGEVVDAVDELHIPDRRLFLFDTAGHPIKPPVAPAWMRAAARAAAVEGRVDQRRHIRHEEAVRLHAERFTLASGVPMVSVVSADQVELEDQYAALIAVFGGAALAALVLVAAGGYFLSRKSTEPVERNIAQMRQFMADAAHELRTPVAVMRTTAEVVLQQDRGGDDYRGALGTVEREAERLGGIVDDLLTLARADAGERPMRKQKVFLDDIALDAAQAASALAKPKGVVLDVGEFEEATLDADPTLVHQLVMNLIHNAIKFTPAGGAVRVDVSMRDEHPVLVVADTGIGIDPEHLPHVFDRFFRGDPARVRSEGAGLGLSIAQWIARVHGAVIHLESTPGTGTRVEVVFPRYVRPPVSSS